MFVPRLLFVLATCSFCICWENVFILYLLGEYVHSVFLGRMCSFCISWENIPPPPPPHHLRLPLLATLPHHPHHPTLDARRLHGPRRTLPHSLSWPRVKARPLSGSLDLVSMQLEAEVSGHPGAGQLLTHCWAKATQDSAGRVGAGPQLCVTTSRLPCHGKGDLGQREQYQLLRDVLEPGFWWLRGKSNLPAMWETWVQSLSQEDSPGEGNGNPLQYSCLGNPMVRGAWWAIVYGIAKSQT